MPRLNGRQKLIKALEVIEEAQIVPQVKRSLADQCLTAPNADIALIRARANLADDFLQSLRDMVNSGELEYRGNT